jgi:hypothetical protein
MSILKDSRNEDSLKLVIAEDLCFDIGAIQTCQHHESVYLNQLEHSDYVTLTNEILLKNPAAAENFRSRAEMAEYIERVMLQAK